jgi:hypothetical protein
MVTAGTPKHDQLQDHKERNADLGEAAVDMALEPVIRCATPIIDENLRIPCRRYVELVAL